MEKLPDGKKFFKISPTSYTRYEKCPNLPDIIYFR